MIFLVKIGVRVTGGTSEVSAIASKGPFRALNDQKVPFKARDTATGTPRHNSTTSNPSEWPDDPTPTRRATPNGDHGPPTPHRQDPPKTLPGAKPYPRTNPTSLPPPQPSLNPAAPATAARQRSMRAGEHRGSPGEYGPRTLICRSAQEGSGIFVGFTARCRGPGPASRRESVCRRGPRGRGRARADRRWPECVPGGVRWGWGGRPSGC